MRKYRKVDEKGWKEGRGVQNHQHEHEHKKKLKRNLLKGRLRRRMNFKGHIFKLPKSTQSHITVAKEASMDIFSLYLSPRTQEQRHFETGPEGPELED